MKRSLLVFVILILLCSTNSYAATKVDPYLRSAARILSMDNAGFKMAGVEASLSSDKKLIRCLIKATDFDKVEAEIKKLGGTVKTRLKTIMTAEIPPDAISALAELDEVIYIEASKEMRPKMNFARSITGVDTVQTGGGGLPQAYNGSGVVVGVVDSGTDCTHADFHDRIIAYWDQSSNKKYSLSEIRSGACENALTSDSYHGTHVTGIAAGADATYTGNAPESSIAVVQISGSQNDVLDGIEYIFQKAQETKSPAVANLSVGTSLGPHDGTSLFETGLDETLEQTISGTVEEKLGRAVICAAGNETVNTAEPDPGNRFGGLHASIAVSGTDTGYETIIREASVDGFIIDIWLDHGGDCSVKMQVYDATRTSILATSAVAPGAVGSKTVSNVTAEIDFTDSDNANNHKQHAQATITVASGAHSPTAITYDLIFIDNGGGCTGDAWLYPDSTDSQLFTKNRDGTPSPAANYTYSKGDNIAMTTIPSTASGCISVASFSARDTWIGMNGEHHQDVYDPTIGATGSSATDLSLFSSHGPGAGPTVATPRQKPDIAAPGEPIISTKLAGLDFGESITAPDDTHVKFEGTSMSAPYITGVVALLLERNGCLTPTEIKAALINNATADAFTGAVPNYLWGNGKVDALASMLDIASSACQPDNPGDDVSSGGGGGCLLNKNMGLNNIWILIIIFVAAQLPIFCLSILKRRRISKRSRS